MLDKSYASGPVEEKWLKAWEEASLFKSAPRGDPAKKFVIVIPPPNVTGALHLGHALNNTMQDALLRWRRLEGFTACWVPGTDHGGIATQNVMEKELKKKGQTRHELGRGKFLELMQGWTRDCKKTILGQLRRLGCALDWGREAFTMDEARAESVFSAFEALWRKGLIYRGERMVNWCVRCGTALSDIEVEHEERKGRLWHIRYPLEDGAEGLVVATTRPETMLGDTAVAVNPKDSRYLSLVGKRLKLPLTAHVIPVVADEHVDESFGTGAVKVTPAHDPNDFDILGRHPEIGSRKVIGPAGHMTPEAGGDYAGLSREAAREKVVKDLEAAGLLVKVEDHRHAVGVCYRCEQAIEPLLSWQWFVKMSELAAPAARAVEKGDFRIYPETWAKPYLEWLGGIRDWCISRQIWWGHRIPVWYCLDCRPDLPGRDVHQFADLKGVVSVSKPRSCPDCASAAGNFEQDPDVLDTWFSSALWPMSVFGWPRQTPDLKFYYPTTVLVTGYEILYLWVARMQMMGLEFLKQVPFKHAVIHGIVRDKSGKKMSKSLGNVIDPLLMMEKFGTDALRFSLLVQARPGKDIPFAEDSITGSRNFANKLWNSTRFVLMNLPDQAPREGYCLERLSRERLELADRWILAEHREALEKAREAMRAYDVAAACDALYGFLWDKFCDWYIELAKIRLAGAEGEEKEAVRTILVQVLSATLKALHPFMPFITEELFAALKPYSGEAAEYLLNAGAPAAASDWSDPEATGKMRVLMEVTVAIRSLRSQLNVPPGLKISVVGSGGAEDTRALIAGHAGYLKALARIEELGCSADGARPPHSATAVAAGMKFFIPLEGAVDFAEERARLEKELAKVEAELAKIARKISNKDFLARAPEAEVALARSQQEAALAKRVHLKETLAILS